MSPVVSVVIPFFNAERFLDEAIRSVFAQTYDRWEIALVDDGSTDGSPAIANAWAQRYPNRVRYLEHDGHENRGSSASRGLGVRHTSGPLIAPLDADDVWLPHKLKRQVAILSAQPQAGMVFGLTEYWYSWSGARGDRDRDFVFALGVPPDTLIQPPGLLTSFFLRQDAPVPSHSNVMVRRQALDPSGGYVDEFRGAYDDQVFYAKLCLATPVIASNECWDRYRQHADSSTALSRRHGREIAERIFFLDWLAAYLEQQGPRDVEIAAALERARQACREGVIPPARLRREPSPLAPMGTRMLLTARRRVLGGLRRWAQSVRSAGR